MFHIILPITALVGCAINIVIQKGKLLKILWVIPTLGWLYLIIIQILGKV